MENATKAMLIAAGTLIGVMILSLGITLYSGFRSYVENSQEFIEANEQNKFNTQFMNYINYTGGEKQFELTIQDIVTVANLAYENNKNCDATVDERGNQSTFYVAVYLNNVPIENDINNIASQLLTDNLQSRTNIQM